MHKYLVDSAPTEREKQRLLRVAKPHASSFVTAVPSEEVGRDTLLRPKVFRVSIKYRLGVPVLPNEIQCPLCEQTINVYGDHATCCRKAGDLITRHNVMRNLVDRIAADGLLNPIIEKQGILGPTSGRRPGDVTIPNWEHGNGLAIDVAVTSPLISSSVRLVNPCEEFGASKKHRKYDVSFEGTDYSFCAMVFETLGAINFEGEAVLKQLFRFAAKQLGREFSSFCGRAWARVSCALQRSVAQAILNRVDGVRPSYSSEESSVGELSSGEPLLGEPLGEARLVEELVAVESSLGVSSVGESPRVFPDVRRALEVKDF
jgi:hypothetical protein